MSIGDTARALSRDTSRPGTAGTESLAGWLRRQPDDVLARMLASRPDLLHPVPPDISVLAARAGGRVSTELALDRLNRGALEVLDALALLPEPSSPADVARLLGVTLKRVTPVLARLRDAVLVWGDAGEARLVPAVRDLVPFPAGLGPPVRDALADVAPARLPGLLADLTALVGEAAPGGEPPAEPTADPAAEPPAESQGDSAAGSETTHRPAAETLDLIAGFFEDPRLLATLLDRIPTKPREVVDLLAAGPPIGRMSGARRAAEAATADTPLRWLLAHGILVAIDDYTVALPREIGMFSRGQRPFTDLHLEPPTVEVAVQATSDADATAAGQAFTTVRLVESLLEKWGIDPPAVLRAGGLGVRDLRRAARELDVDERTAALLVELAHAAGLIGPDGETGESRLPTLGPSGYDAWLPRPVAARWCLLAMAWLTTTRVPALVGRREPSEVAAIKAAMPGARTPAAPNALGPDVDRGLAPLIRRDVLRVLGEVKPGEAPSTDAIIETLRWSSPRRGGELRDNLARWCHEEAEMLGLTGRGALSSFGRVLASTVVTGPDDDAPDAVSAAADLLRPLLPDPLDHVLLQADLTAVAPGPLESDLSRELSLMADVESTGGATVFRFSAHSIRRALDAGRSASDIHALLAEKSRTPVPQPLTYLVDDVARRHGRIRVGGATAYIRCDDETVLTEVLADRRVASLRLRRLAPTILVSPLSPERIAERLREVGYTPAAENPEGGLLLRRPDARRAPTRPRPSRRVELGTPSLGVTAVAVRAIRGGDRAVTARRSLAAGPDPSASDLPPRSAASETLSVLRDAAETGRPLWIGYLNAQGQASNRVVEPLRLAGGYLTAFDHRHDEVRTFAVHRITGVASLDDAADAAAGPDADTRGNEASDAT